MTPERTALYARKVRFRGTFVAAVLAFVVLLLPAACGGDDDAPSDAAAATTSAATLEPTATVPPAALAGTWTEGSFVVGFTRDGTFAIDTDGSVEDGEFVKGTYSLEGSRIRFVADELGPRGCGGQEWEWEIALEDSGMLAAELLQEVCQTAAGTHWSLVKRPNS